MDGKIIEIKDLNKELDSKIVAQKVMRAKGSDLASALGVQ